MPRQVFKNILIVKLSSLGDVIHALPCVAALRQLYPNARITWITEPAYAGFLPGKPYLDEVLLFNKVYMRSVKWSEKIAYFRTLRKSLRERHFDLVLDLQGLMKSAIVAWMTGAPNKLGYCEMRELSGLVSQAVCGEFREAHVIERYLDVVRYLGATIQEVNFPLPDLSAESDEIKNILATLGSYSRQGLVVLAPGTSWSSKCWPVEKFAAVADRLRQAGYDVVVIGGTADQSLGQKIAATNDRGIFDLTGKTNLRQLAALLQQAKLCISGDTGPMHIAVAAGTPLVAIFGPTNPHRTGPYGKHHIVLTADVSCRPCFKKQCEKLDCMYQVGVEQVLDAASVLLSKPESSSSR